MRHTCSCGARISTLKNLRVEQGGINHFGRQLMVRGSCWQCGQKHCFLPNLLDPKKLKKGSHNYNVIMFGKYLAKKARKK